MRFQRIPRHSGQIRQAPGLSTHQAALVDTESAPRRVCFQVPRETTRSTIVTSGRIRPSHPRCMVRRDRARCGAREKPTRSGAAPCSSSKGGYSTPTRPTSPPITEHRRRRPVRYTPTCLFPACRRPHWPMQIRDRPQPRASGSPLRASSPDRSFHVKPA